MFGFIGKVSPIWMDIMLGAFHLVLNHHLEYSHVTAWRMINDKAHPINGHAFAKRPLFISCTCHNKNSVIKFRWFPSDVYQKTRCLCASSHVLGMTSNVIRAWVCKAARTRTLDGCGWKMAALKDLSARGLSFKIPRQKNKKHWNVGEKRPSLSDVFGVMWDT